MITATDVLKIAQGQIDTVDPLKFNRWYYGSASQYYNEDWCVVFLQWCCYVVSEDRYWLSNGTMTASCSYLLAHPNGSFILNYHDLQPGDIVFFNFEQKQSPQHVGIVESYVNGYLVTIEGNTDNGNVRRKTRYITNIVGAFRPYYDQEVTEVEKRYNKVSEMPIDYQTAVQYYIDAGVVKGHTNGLDLSDDMCRILVYMYRANGI